MIRRPPAPELVSKLGQRQEQARHDDAGRWRVPDRIRIPARSAVRWAGCRCLFESEACRNRIGARPFTTVLSPRRVMVLWGSVVALLASVAGLVTLGSIHFVGDLAGLAFVTSARPG